MLALTKREPAASVAAMRCRSLSLKPGLFRLMSDAPWPSGAPGAMGDDWEDEVDDLLDWTSGLPEMTD